MKTYQKSICAAKYNRVSKNPRAIRGNLSQAGFKKSKGMDCNHFMLDGFVYTKFDRTIKGSSHCNCCKQPYKIADKIVSTYWRFKVKPVVTYFTDYRYFD